MINSRQITLPHGDIRSLYTTMHTRILDCRKQNYSQLDQSAGQHKHLEYSRSKNKRIIELAKLFTSL